jgi:diaminopimelate decarboxylase
MSGPAPAGLFALTGAEALAVASRRKTPCFVYRLDIARARYAELRAALPERAVLAYAIKANPGRELVAAFAGLGASLDCASIGELELARGAGVPGDRVLFAGPGKSLEEIELALAMGARIQADGIEDLERIEAALAGRPEAPRGGRLAISLRVHPASGVEEGSRIIGGAGPSAFGVDEERVGAFVEEAKRFRLLAITGLQVFASSNERDARRLLANHRTAFRIGEALQAATGSALELIDLGGGLGIPYSGDEAELDLRAFGSGLGELLRDNPWFGGRIVVEPGRWLAGPCGAYLTRVVRTKESRGERFAILEGGLNHLLRPLLAGQAFPSCAPGKEEADGRSGEAPAATRVTLAGPLCTSLDRLGVAELPPLAAGDLLMLGQAGAYGATEAMGAFLSHPPAGEYWLEGPPAYTMTDERTKHD